MNLAYAHSAAGAAAPPEGLGLWLEWTLDPTFLVPLAVALLYWRGLRAYRRRRPALFPWWRPAAFAAGIALIAVALLSPVDRLADVSFTWHMAQHMLLVQVAMPLLLLGAPFLPVVRGLPGRFRRRVFLPFANHPAVRAGARALVHPVTGFLVYVGALWAWHAPALYDAALLSEPVHYFEHFCFVVAGVLFHWHVVTPFPFRSRMHYLVRVGYLFVATIQNSALGSMITLSGTVLYAYADLGAAWGMSPARDQLVGGILMWVGGGMMHLGLALIVLAVYAAEEGRKEPPRPAYIERGPSPTPA